MIDRILMQHLVDEANRSASSRPAAVGTLVAAATQILLEDVGPDEAVEILQRLVTSTKEIFSEGDTIQ